MIYTAGIDVGSTYAKALVLDADDEIVGRSMEPTGFMLAEVAERVYQKAMEPTGFMLAEVAERVYQKALAEAGLSADQVAYLIATGYGRHQVRISDLQVTDLTAAARGTTFFFPGTQTILDVGGQTMTQRQVRRGHGRVPGEDRPLHGLHDRGDRPPGGHIQGNDADLRRLRGVRRI